MLLGRTFGPRGRIPLVGEIFLFHCDALMMLSKHKGHLLHDDSNRGEVSSDFVLGCWPTKSILIERPKGSLYAG